ncbi:U2 small nuclear ribonucleoprotein A [Gregarina niphandrodes]|uniref:U2 small nuclear ribonucleoprotein A n=1 Tax=Gregarina niphandrodes TaxID=110365 RepID=A0A023B0K3_GRENI|nr:U2 small nuclear ribonucleoprotein A [Gregarina niphandrodes]EZG45145.1 U2 small nuclear ribonucleoprotein A [Gregarina niphandrodes]|eukprot:XP_011132546.1 U2 small nuclear ribonucleoprotein A [Gregarina niphandrodes]
MRCTKDLLKAAKETLNPCGSRMLNLRGYRIEVIENLGVLNDAYECIDFSENELVTLDGFPPMQNLKHLIVAQNRVCRISEDLHESIPNLVSLVLAGNLMTDVKYLEPLKHFKHLQRISLVDNPVDTVVVGGFGSIVLTLRDPQLRKYLIGILPSIRFIDFTKVTQSERAKQDD